MQKGFVFLAHTVCSWKPSWPETKDDVLWAAGYSRSSVFLWRVGHINSWFCIAMQLVGTVIILSADKCEKVHKVLAAAFSFPRWVGSAGAQWPLRLTWWALKHPQAQLVLNYGNSRHREDDFPNRIPRVSGNEINPTPRENCQYIDAALGSCITPDILCVSPCLKVLWPTDRISNLPLQESWHSHHSATERDCKCMTKPTNTQEQPYLKLCIILPLLLVLKFSSI